MKASTPAAAALRMAVGQTVGLLVGGQGVHGQVDLAAAGMGVDDALGQLFRREVGRG